MSSPTIVGTPVNNSGTGVSSLTTSITVPGAGSNLAVIVIPIASAGNNAAFSSVTLNGSSMTQIVSVAGAQNNGGIMYFTSAPTTGAQNIVLNGSSGSVDMAMIAFVLQDCVQASGSVVDATGANVSGISGTSAAPTVTTSLSNDIVIGWSTTRSLGVGMTTSQTAVSGTPFDPLGTNFSQFMAATNSPGSSGSQTINFSWTNADHFDSFVTSLAYVAPSATVLAPQRKYRSLLGVGT